MTVKKDPNDGLKIASGGQLATTVSIQLASEADLAEERAKKLADSEARRVQNALPSWIAQSTVDGGFTAAGMRDKTAGAAQEIPTSPTRSPGKEAADGQSYVACHTWLMF